MKNSKSSDKTTSPAAPSFSLSNPLVQGSKRNRKIGLILLLAPITLIVVSLALFAVFNTVFRVSSLPSTSSVPSGSSNPSATQPSSSFVQPLPPRIAQATASSPQIGLTVINFVFGLLGLIGVVGIIVCTPIGIYFLVKKEQILETYDHRSGKGSTSEIPKEIVGWNWGAAGLSWIWGVYHHAWISLLVFLPFVNLFFWIILGLKGNEWAWRKTQWESVEAFKKAQDKWKPWGIAFLVLDLIVVAATLRNAF